MQDSEQAAQQALQAVVVIVCAFPEVAIHMLVGMPPELSPLWQGELSRQSFDSFEFVAESRAAVYKVSLGGRQFAAKEYRLGAGREVERQRTCLQEAAWL